MSDGGLDAPWEVDVDHVGEHPVTFHRALERDGLSVVDLVERQRYTVGTGGPVAPTAAADDLLFPVDAAASVRTDELLFPSSPSMYVRDVDGAMVANPTPSEEVELPAGEYYLDVNPPIKLYLRVRGPLTLSATLERKRVSFDGPRQVVVGGRSMHERPAGTVTTTAEPADVMAAVSAFGSALKTTSPERSFPTLRGHPPALELGDALSIPDELAPRRTDVTIEVPAEYRYVYPVAPLAHYLGAQVVPGDRPRLVTDAGVDHDLAPGGAAGRAFEREVERVLKRTFLLDSVVRTEGLYEVDLHERHVVERRIDRDLDLPALYDAPLAERLATYLEVPYDELAPAVPDWKLTAYVEPDPSTVEALAFLVNDLAVVRVEPSAGGGDARDRSATARTQQSAVDELLGGTASRDRRVQDPDLPVEESGAMEVAWVGDGAPRGASKVTAEGYRHRLDREPVDGGDTVTVVCNDPEMADERELVDGVYGGEADLDVTCHQRLSTRDLAAVLAEDSAFLHYVGHVDEGGFRCHDGLLDARTLEDVGVESFLLNACDTFEQGMALVDAGAVGGVVTLKDVTEDSALLVGVTVARLLHNGYPLRPALEIAREASYVGEDYVVVGDGTTSVVPTETKALDMFRVDGTPEAPVLEYVSYACLNAGMGIMSCPNVGDNEQYYLEPGTLDSFEMGSVDELLDFLTRRELPVLLERDLHWSTDIDREKLLAVLER